MSGGITGDIKPKYVKAQSSDLLYLVKQRLNQITNLEAQALPDGVRVRVELPEAFYSHVFSNRNQAREFLHYSEFQVVFLRMAQQQGLIGILFDTQAYIFATMQTSELRQLCEDIENNIGKKCEAVWNRKDSERRQNAWQSERQYQPSKSVQDFEASIKQKTDELEIQKCLVAAEIEKRKLGGSPTEILPSFIELLIPEPVAVMQPPPTPKLIPGIDVGLLPLTYTMKGVEYQLNQPNTLEELRRMLWITQKLKESKPELHRVAVAIITYCLVEKENCQIIELEEEEPQVIIWEEDKGILKRYAQYQLLNTFSEFARKLNENPYLQEGIARWKTTAAEWLTAN
jgi:hypothetical protein